MIDIQSSRGTSLFPLDAVGISGIQYPITIGDKDSGIQQRVAAEWTMGVSLPKEQKGTHMSRFVELLQEASEGEVYDLDAFMNLSRKSTQRLEAGKATISAKFPWFRKVEAPVSKRVSMMTYEMEFQATAGQQESKSISVKVPAKALCPCSKAISERGAHNQRSIIQVRLNFAADARIPSFVSIIKSVEDSASSALYPLMKREDEKYVTELAYDNPVFVEDIARNVAERICDIAGLVSFTVKALNQESIHNHDCFAELTVEVRR